MRSEKEWELMSKLRKERKSRKEAEAKHERFMKAWAIFGAVYGGLVIISALCDWLT